MIIKILLITFAISFIIGIYLRKRNIKKLYRKKKLTMVEWMGMSNQDRYLSDVKDRKQKLNRKKILLSHIRREYKKVAKIRR